MRKAVKKRWWVWVLQAVLGLALLLVLSLALAWWRLPDVLNYGAARWLPGLGLDQARVTVDTAGRRELVLDAVAAGPGWRAELGQLHARYTLAGLWSGRQAETLVLDRLHLEVDVPTIRREGFPFIPESDEPFDPYDFSWIALLPAARIEVRDALLTVTMEGFSGTVAWSTRILAESPEAAAVEFTLAYEELSADLSGQLRKDEISRLSLASDLRDPVVWGQRLLPDWREQFDVPPEFAIGLGPVDMASNVAVYPDRRLEVTAEARMHSIETALEPGSLSVSGVRMRLATDAARQIHLEMEAERIGGAWDETRLRSQPWRLEVETDDLRRWRVAAPLPLQGEHADVVRAAVAFGAEVDLGRENSPIEFQVTLDITAMRVTDYELDPWQVRLTGSETAVSIHATDPRLAENPQARIENLRGQVERVGDAGIKAVLHASLGRDALEPWSPGLSHAPIDFEACGSIEGAAMAFELDVGVRQGEVIARVPGGPELSGALSASLAAGTLDAGARWSGDAALSGGDLAAHGPGWSAEGLGLEGTVRLSGFEPDILRAAQPDLAEAFERLARAVEARLDWQANAIVTETVGAQWASGYFTLPQTGENGVPVLEIHVSAGIVDLLEESLQQVALTLQTSGDLEQLDLQGELGFWYAGSEGKVTFSHVLRNFTDSPEVAGSYEMRPFAFDYVDAVGRYLPDFEGLSFSGDLTASGQYWFREGAADASLEARFDRGSVDFPASQITVQGIGTRIRFSSLMNLTGAPEGSEITIESVRAGDISAANGRVVLNLLDASTMRLLDASVEIFGGRVSVDPAPVVLDPLAVEGIIRFDRISLAEVAQQMSFFDGNMEGVVSGFMPFSYEDGIFVPREGVLRLPEGETARLRYNSRGLMTGPDGEVPEAEEAGFMDRLSARILRTLELQPEKMVEDALADLLISRLQVELFSEETPRTPIRIQFAGEATSGNTIVPLNLETNVHGTLDELYNFLIRLNSLGPASF